MFPRRRDLRFVEHTVATLVGQRVFGIALGYEDLNDHDELRHDPVMAVLAGKLEAWRDDCAPVAGKIDAQPPRTVARGRHALQEDQPRPGGDRGALRRPLPRGPRPAARADRARPRRHRRPVCTAIRRAASSTAITTATAICRCTSSAAGIFWRPLQAVEHRRQRGGDGGTRADRRANSCALARTRFSFRADSGSAARR